jgi:hypothetical protein
MNEKKRRWIGTLEVAAKLGCHPMSVPRMTRNKPGFPQPVKPFKKNLWDEQVFDEYLATLIAAQQQLR